MGHDDTARRKSLRAVFFLEMARPDIWSPWRGELRFVWARFCTPKAKEFGIAGTQLLWVLTGQRED